MLFDDLEVHRFLEEQAPFDAVTIWLIGTYMWRKDCRNLTGLNIANGGDYRLRVQNRVYELAAKILRPCGILQVVDRGEAPSTESLMSDHMQAHRDQASVTDLEVFDVKFRTYTEPADRGVRMVASPGTSGRTAATEELSMISTLSRRPQV